MASQVKWYGRQRYTEIEARLSVGLDRLAADIVQTAQQSMRESKSGHPVPTGFKQYGMRKKKQYPKGRIAGWGHQRSAPGEAPAVQTSRLIANIGWESIAKLRRRIGTNVKYGKWLEFGIRGGKMIVPKRARALAFIIPSGELIMRRKVRQGRIEKRPWLLPAIKKVRANAERRMANAMRLP